jgi:hypothetical protein
MISYPERELLGHAYAGAPEKTEPSSCPMASGGSWNKWHPFRASFTLEPTSPPMWVQVETTVTGEKCTKWGWFKCNVWTQTTETQTQWHLSRWSNHFNFISITDVFKSPVVSVKTGGCKPVTPCEHPEHIELDTTIQ